MSEPLLDLTTRPGSFVEEIPFGVWICDAEGGLTYASDSFLELVDMPLEDACGFGWTQRLVAENGDSLKRWRECVESGHDWDDEHCIRDRDGYVRTLLARGQAVRDEFGRITSWVGVHLDITKRKRDEERLRVLKMAEARRQERERIAQRLHDHLQQLLIGADLQLQGIRNLEANETVSDGLLQASEILTQAIQASRNLAAELNPPVLYESGLAAALQWLQTFMHETHGIQVQMDVEIEREPAATEVREVLFDAVRELLLNVVKHADVERASVTARRTNGEIRIVVNDEGSGFDTDRPDCEGDPAAGLGLSGIRRRIDALGGHCHVTSALGRGTTVEILVSTSASAD